MGSKIQEGGTKGRSEGLPPPEGEKMTVDTFSIEPTLRDRLLTFSRERNWSKARAIRHAIRLMLGEPDLEE